MPRLRKEQKRKGQTVQVYVRGYGYSREADAYEEAEKVARICHGLWDWQGTRETTGPAGLEWLANLWLKRSRYSHCRVVEVNNGDTDPCDNPRSTYYPDWVR